MGKKTGTDSAGKILSAFFQTYIGESLSKGKKALRELLDARELKNDIGMYVADIRALISDISSEQSVNAIEAFLSVAPREMKLKIIKKLSIEEQDNLAKQSDELKAEVAYLRFWMKGEGNMLSPKIRTFADLKKVCADCDIELERTFTDSATLTSVETKKGVSFFLESGDYKRGPRVAVVPPEMLYK